MQTAAFWVLVAAAVQAPAPAPLPEKALKRELLRRIPDFADWPLGRLPGGSPLVVGVVGENVFQQEGELKDSWKASRFQKVQVLVIRRWSELESCHMVYLGSGAYDSIPAVLGILRGRPVLTVSDAERAADQGFMVGIQVSPSPGTPSKLLVNMEAVRQSGIQMRSQFLRLCQVVRP